MSQDKVLDKIKDMSWFTPKDVHEAIKKDTDLSYMSVSRSMQRLMKWRLLERVRDKTLIKVCKYRLVELDEILDDETD
jgi:predicted transcriptional regulator